MKKVSNRFKILSWILIIMSFFNVMVMSMNPISAKALSDIKFDKTYVLDDLNSDSSFNVLSYPCSPLREPSLIRMEEYCYSQYNNIMSDFGLYLYIYNPKALEIIDCELNTVSLAISFDSSGNPNDFEKFEMKLCSVSKEPYENLFLKFKIIDHVSANGKYISEIVSKESRLYHLASFELMAKDYDNPVDYPIGKTYCFSGFSKGCAEDLSAPSTLTSYWYNNEVIELDVHHTSWLSQSSANYGLNAGRNTVDSVYFQLPKSLIEKYGSLQRIKAEWYEYWTNPIFVTNNKELYSILYSHIGTKDMSALPVGMSNEALIWDDYPKYSLNYKTQHDDTYLMENFPYLLRTKEWDCDINSEEAEISKEELLDYMRWYTDNIAPGSERINGADFSVDLFTNDIKWTKHNRNQETERGIVQCGLNGKSVYDFDLTEDKVTFESAKDVFVPTFWTWLFGICPPNESGKELSVIQPLQSSDFIADDFIVSDNLCIDIDDVAPLKEMTEDEENITFLFRFANNEYISTTMSSGDYRYTSYISQQAMYFDFDIIQFTFKGEDNVLNVLPVVSSPIDIVHDVYAPTATGCQFFNNLYFIISAIILILVIILLIQLGILPAVLKFLVKAIWWIISAPFKFIAFIIKKIKGDN